MAKLSYRRLPKTVSILFYLANSIFLQAAIEVPLSKSALNDSIDSDTAVSSISLSAADDALSSGLYSIAERFYRNALENERLTKSIRQNVLIKLTACYLNSGQKAKAIETIGQVKAPFPDRYYLIKSLLHYNDKEYLKAEQYYNSIAEAKLSSEDTPWFYLISGLILHTKNDEKAESLFQTALAHCFSNNQKAHFETIIFQAEIEKEQPNDDLALELKQKSNDFQGQAVGFQFARQYIIVLSQLKKKDEAIKVIEEQLNLLSENSTTDREKLLLLTGKIVGPDSGKGNLALNNLLLEGSNAELMHEALFLISKDTENYREDSPFTILLDGIISRKAPHPLLENILYKRAFIAYNNDNLRAAENLVLQLTKQYPGSPLTQKAIRLYVKILWNKNPPEYRIAASVLNTLINQTNDINQKHELNQLLADCFYLDKDYKNAADTYALVFSKTRNKQKAKEIFFQLLISEIKAEKIDEAIQHLDKTGNTHLENSSDRWKAEWMLTMSLLKLKGQDVAYKRVKMLMTNISEKTPPDLRIRLKWLEIQLAMNLKKTSLALELIETISLELNNETNNILEDSIKQDIKAHLLLTKGRAFIEKKENEKGLSILTTLKETYPDSEAAITAILLEALHYNHLNQVVDAQNTLINLADTYPKSNHAPQAIYEAAINAEKRAISSSFEEAIQLLDRLIKQYPDHPLVFYAKLKQGHILRKINDFSTALQVYENLNNQYKNHPEIELVKISISDCLLSQGEKNNKKYEEAISLLEKLSDAPNISLNLKYEADYKRGYAYSKIKKTEDAIRVYWSIIHHFKNLKSDNQESIRKYWISRSVIDLAEIIHKNESPDAAKNIYQLILDYNLPGQALAKSKLEI